MRRVSAALGVSCAYCHPHSDFSADTRERQLANFMATELVPRLRTRSGGPVTCEHCHVRGGHGVAKLLGQPRTEARALDFMVAQLSEEFVRTDGKPLACKDCHSEAWGSPGFQRRLLLGAALERLPR